MFFTPFRVSQKILLESWTDCASVFSSYSKHGGGFHILTDNELVEILNIFLVNNTDNEIEEEAEEVCPIGRCNNKWKWWRVECVYVLKE